MADAIPVLSAPVAAQEAPQAPREDEAPSTTTEEPVRIKRIVVLPGGTIRTDWA